MGVSDPINELSEVEESIHQKNDMGTRDPMNDHGGREGVWHRCRRGVRTRRGWVCVWWRWCILLAMVLLTQMWFGVHNRDYFTVENWWRVVLGNVHFAVATASFFMLPYAAVCLLPARWRGCRAGEWAGRVLWGGALLAVIVPGVADVPYFQWTGRRMTGDIFGYISSNFSGGWGTLIVSLLRDFSVYVVGGVLMTVTAWWTAERVRPARKSLPTGWRRAGSALVGVLTVGVLLVGMRGGVMRQTKPLRIIDAGRYAPSGSTALVVNTPFSIYRTLGHTTDLHWLDYMSAEEAEEVFSPVGEVRPVGDVRCNIVLIILESFSAEYMGCYNGGDVSWTPFLDSLSASCLRLRGMSNGRRSIESLPSLLSGIPSMSEEAYITSTLSQNQVHALPQMLREQGYSTAFFHGAYNGSMNFDRYVHSIGVERYYGMDEYGDTTGYDGVWGIFDGPFLQYTARTLSTLPEPFFVTIYTISSHHPYSLPTSYRDTFAPAPLPILPTVAYADHALRQFFASARRARWFNSTLFVITADHTAQPLPGAVRTAPAAYEVPMLFYDPSGRLPLPPTSETPPLMQHTDLLPTLADLMGLGSCRFAFGRSAYDSSTAFHVAYLSPDEYMLTRRGTVSLMQQGRLTACRCTAGWHSATDSLRTAQEEEHFLQAFLQQYNNRLLNNRTLCNAPARKDSAEGTKRPTTHGESNPHF